MSTDNEIGKIIILFDRLQRILEEHRGDNHIVGVRLAISELSSDEVSSAQRRSNARSIFKTMMGGMGTLGDFVIFDEDERKRIELNNELDSVLKKLWECLDC